MSERVLKSHKRNFDDSLLYAPETRWYASRPNIVWALVLEGSVQWRQLAKRSQSNSLVNEEPGGFRDLSLGRMLSRYLVSDIRNDREMDHMRTLDS